MGDWREKFRKLIKAAADEIGVERPRLAVVRRDSGPTLPPNWHQRDYQRRMCVRCRLPIVGLIELYEGKWCGPCWTFAILPGRAVTPELPPAA